MYQSIPKPPIPPLAIIGHLTRVKLRTEGNLTQNEAQPVGHLTIVSNLCRHSLIQQVSRIVDSTWVFLLLSCYIVISWNMPLFKAWSEVKLNKKFELAENFVWASFADILKSLQYQEMREMINRRIFKYIEFILFTVLLENLKAF